MDLLDLLHLTHSPAAKIVVVKKLASNGPVHASSPPPVAVKPIQLSKDDTHYLNQLGKREGDGDPKATNPSGAAGLHQFMPIIWIDGIIAWVPDYIHRYVDTTTLTALKADRDFLVSVRKHIRNVNKNDWIVTLEHDRNTPDKEKTKKLQVILMKRFDQNIDKAMTLAQRDDNHSFLIAHGCVKKPTFGDEALAHEQGPSQACALIKAARTNGKISAVDVLSHVQGVTKGKLKANVHQNPLIFGYRTVGKILGDVDHFMGRPIDKLAKALKGKGHASHRHKHHRDQAKVDQNHTDVKQLSSAYALSEPVRKRIFYNQNIVL